ISPPARFIPIRRHSPNEGRKPRSDPNVLREHPPVPPTRTRSRSRGLWPQIPSAFSPTPSVSFPWRAFLNHPFPPAYQLPDAPPPPLLPPPNPPPLQLPLDLPPPLFINIPSRNQRQPLPPPRPPPREIRLPITTTNTIRAKTSRSPPIPPSSRLTRVRRIGGCPLSVTPESAAI